MRQTKVAVLVRLLPTLKANLSEIAKREHRSLSQQVEFFLERCVEGIESNLGEEGASPADQKNQSAIGAKKKRVK
jgi:hypothetical protein